MDVVKTLVLGVALRMQFVKGFTDGVRPIKKIPVSEWSDKYRILSNVGSARPGKYKTANTPYLREISDALSATNSISEVVFMKAAQIGATEIGNNWIGYIMHIAPAATLMVMPTDETVIKNSKVRIAPMIRDTSVLRKRINLSKSKEGGNTIKEKEFPGGILIMVSAGSSVGLRSLPIKNLMLDEIDGYVTNLDNEGSPISLAIVRTNTYIDAGRKIFYISTPTTDGVSAIQKEYENSDKRKFYVPCPKCGVFQTLEFDNLTYIIYDTYAKDTYHLVEIDTLKKDDVDHDCVRMQCQACPELISERHKLWMILNGHWEATNKEWKNKKRVGYHLNALYSTLGYKWSQAISDYLDAVGDELKMCTFTNTVLGEVYKEKVEVPEWSALYGRRKHYRFGHPPEPVCMITVGVDVQKDRLEYEVIGWCPNRVTYSVDYKVLIGDTDGDKVWEDLKKVIEQTWRREDGAIMPMRMMCVDSSYNTLKVYDFCKQFSTDKVVPIKGMGEKMHAIVGRPTHTIVSQAGKPIGKAKAWAVGDAVIKTELYGQLRQIHIDGQPLPQGYCYFPQYDEHYFKMLVAEERRIVVNKKGKREYNWVLPSHKRNEALDCRVYGRAAAYLAGIDRWKAEDWQIIHDSYPIEDAPPAEPPAKKKGSAFLGGESIW